MANTRNAESRVSIRLKRSPIGTPYRHRLVLCGLGLRKMHHTVIRPATPQVRGMIAKISYLLDVKVV